MTSLNKNRPEFLDSNLTTAPAFYNLCMSKHGCHVSEWKPEQHENPESLIDGLTEITEIERTSVMVLPYKPNYFSKG